MDQSISSEIIDDYTAVIVTGSELDNNNAHEMFEVIAEKQSKGHFRIIIDMQKLEFLSSAGVGSIIGTVETSRENGGEIILCGLSPTIEHILSVLDLDDYLTIAKDKETALTLSRETSK
ncbi:MAG: STAS domain-containing protein [candidate division Zixibacteria bacterium]|nr:STAS domain-containing protein [candidate division Zixibacteria bacterium]